MDIEQLGQIIGDKWQIQIIYYCGNEGLSFNELQKKLKISRSVLTRKLNRLVSLNIIRRENITAKFKKRAIYLISKEGNIFHKKIFELLLYSEPTY